MANRVQSVCPTCEVMKKAMLILAIVLVALLSGGIFFVRVLGPRMIFVPPPHGEGIGAVDSPLSQTSRLAVNFSISLELLTRLAAERIPLNSQGSEVKDFHERIKNGAYAWDITRGDITLQNTGNALAFSTPIEGAARLRGDIDAKFLQFPLDSTAQIAGIIGGTLAPTLNADWQIAPNLVPELSLSQANLAIGPFGQLDISRLLGGGLGQLLQKEAAKLAPGLADAFDVREGVTALWDEGHVGRVVSEEPPLWLSVRPRQVQMGPTDYRVADRVSIPLALVAETQISNRPLDPPAIAVLPPLEVLAEAPTSDLRLPIVLSMIELNRLLADQTFKIDTGPGPDMNISKLEAAVAQDGLLDLKLNIEADNSWLGRGVAGEIWVRGRPIIDYEGQSLGFSEVSLSVETRDKLALTATWLLEKLLVKGIESQLRIRLDKYRGKIDEAINDSLARAGLPEGISLEVNDLAVSLAEVYTITRPTPNGPADPGIVIVIAAKGDVISRLDGVLLDAVNREP
jgi:Domain of unknown function (DUF4403)